MDSETFTIALIFTFFIGAGLGFYLASLIF